MDDRLDLVQLIADSRRMQARLLTLGQVAEILEITTRQVYALVRVGELRGIQVGGRNQWRVDFADLEAYQARSDRHPDDDPPAVAVAL